MNSFRSIEETDKFAASSFCPENLRDLGESPNARLCTEILSELKESLINSQKRSKDLEVASNKFRGRFSKRNTFKFKTELNTEADFMEFADNLSDFLLNEKIEDYRERTSNRYSDILARIAKEIGDVTRQRAEIEKIISGINRDFIEKNFAGVIKSIALRTEESSDKLMRLMLAIQKFFAENQYALGEINLFSTGNTENANREAVNLLLQFVKSLNEESNRTQLKLSDSFRLQFRVQENDNEGMLVENIVAQMLTAAGHNLYFYSNSSREDAKERMEIDFLISKGKITSRHNISPIEVKSSTRYTLNSLRKCIVKFGEQLATPYVLHGGGFARKRRHHLSTAIHDGTIVRRGFPAKVLKNSDCIFDIITYPICHTTSQIHLSKKFLALQRAIFSQQANATAASLASRDDAFKVLLEDSSKPSPHPKVLSSLSPITNLFLYLKM